MSGCRRFLPDFFEEFHRLRHCFIQIWLYLERPNIWILLQVSFYFLSVDLNPYFMSLRVVHFPVTSDLVLSRTRKGCQALETELPPLKPDFLIAGRGWKSLRRRDERIRGDTGNGDVELSHRVSSKKHKKFWWVLVFVTLSMYFPPHKNTFSDFEEKSGRRRIFMADHGCHPSRAPWWAQPWQWGPLGRTLAPPPFFRGTFIWRWR